MWGVPSTIKVETTSLSPTPALDRPALAEGIPRCGPHLSPSQRIYISHLLWAGKSATEALRWNLSVSVPPQSLGFSKHWLSPAFERDLLPLWQAAGLAQGDS